MAKVQAMTRGQKLKKRSSERLTEGASPPRTSGESEADEMSLGVKDDPALLPSDADVTGQKPSLNAWSREILGLSAAIPNETHNQGTRRYPAERIRYPRRIVEKDPESGK
ncbi:unnamed protein product [Fusarium fujikuroi]|nr:unnamed protein product [Fusarium fujikuroi]